MMCMYVQVFCLCPWACVTVKRSWQRHDSCHLKLMCAVLEYLTVTGSYGGLPSVHAHLRRRQTAATNCYRPDTVPTMPTIRSVNAPLPKPFTWEWICICVNITVVLFKLSFSLTKGRLPDVSVNVTSLWVPGCVWFGLEQSWRHLFPAAMEWWSPPPRVISRCVLDAFSGVYARVVWIRADSFVRVRAWRVIEVTQYLPVQLSFLKPASVPGRMTRVLNVLSQPYPLSPPLHVHVWSFHVWLAGVVASLCVQGGGVSVIR